MGRTVCPEGHNYYKRMVSAQTTVLKDEYFWFQAIRKPATGLRGGQRNYLNREFKTRF